MTIFSQEMVPTMTAGQILKITNKIRDKIPQISKDLLWISLNVEILQRRENQRGWKDNDTLPFETISLRPLDVDTLPDLEETTMVAEQTVGFLILGLSNSETASCSNPSLID
ncbi:hypothetical protein V6N13_106650 [Hibiscus sabdariffa]